MSSMLEQAVVDADALREVAIKNAEATVIEKYAISMYHCVPDIDVARVKVHPSSPAKDERFAIVPLPVEAVPADNDLRVMA